MLEKLNMDLVYLTLWLSIGILLAFGGIIYTLVTIQEKLEMLANGLNFIFDDNCNIHSKLNELVVSKHIEKSKGKTRNLSEEEANEPENDSIEPKNFNYILDTDLISVLESKSSPDSQSFRIRAQVH